jgi:hypothetical protein
VSENEKEKYAREWQENEYSLGRGEFLNLFNYIRMIFVKSRSKKLLHEEILEELNTKSKIKEFLEQELPPYCELYAEILNPTEIEVRNIVKVLEATNQKDWVAPQEQAWRQLPSPIETSRSNKFDDALHPIHRRTARWSLRAEKFAATARRIELEHSPFEPLFDLIGMGQKRSESVKRSFLRSILFKMPLIRGPNL